LTEAICWQVGELGGDEYLFVGFKESFINQLCLGFERLGFIVQSIWPAPWVDLSQLKALPAKERFDWVCVEPGMAQALYYKGDRRLYRRWAWQEATGLGLEIQRLIAKDNRASSPLFLQLMQGVEPLLEEAPFEGLGGDVLDPSTYTIPNLTKLELRLRKLMWIGACRRYWQHVPKVLGIAACIPLGVGAYAAGKALAYKAQIKELEAKIAPLVLSYEHMRDLSQSLKQAEATLLPMQAIVDKKERVNQLLYALEGALHSVGRTYLSSGEFIGGVGGKYSCASFQATMLLDEVDDAKERAKALEEALGAVQRQLGLAQLQYEALQASCGRYLTAHVRLSGGPVHE
jgi:hypothetical protein